MLGALLRSKAVYVPLTLLCALLFLASVSVGPLPSTLSDHRDRLISHITPGGSNGRPKYAFATFLADTLHANDTDSNHDHYFIATRMLAYQLLHAPETRSTVEIPFIVMVTEDIQEEKRERLQKDGAIVIQGDSIHAEWIMPDRKSWGDVLTKLRFWELTDYDRICFLDSDTVLTRPIDGIFDDPAVSLQATGNISSGNSRENEDLIPATYGFAGIPEFNRQHGYPPRVENHDYPNINYLNAGLFIIQPSKALFDYYMALLVTPDLFDSRLPEQNLLNYAHRRDGSMPWMELNYTWNIHYPDLKDLEGGVATLHEKWWSPEKKEIGPYLEAWRWRMEGYFEAMDEQKDEAKA